MTAETLHQTLKTLYDPGDVIEIRIIEDHGKNQSGYYDYEHFDKLADDADKLDGLPGIPGIYITVNPVQPILLARSNNKIKKAKETTTDSQTQYRKYIPFDIDPVRPAGVSSTDELHDRSIEKAHEIKEWLKERGLPDPIIADSGNGAHLLYKIDEPNTPEAKELIEAVQKAVIAALNRPELDNIDIQGFANASRIWKFYGTIAKKGEEIPELGIIHRRSKILEVPDDIQTATTEQLKTVAALYQTEPTKAQQDKPQQKKQTNNSGKFDIEGWMNTHDIKVVRTKKERGKTIYVLKTCPLNPDHSGNKEAVIIQEESGKLGFKCHHSSCADKHWSDVRAKYEPGYKEQKQKTDNHFLYFDERNKFVPKILADEILHENDIFTYQDTKEIAVYDTGVYSVAWGEDILRKYAQDKLGDDFNTSRLKEVIEYIKLKTLINRHDINPDEFLINVKNGMYDVVNDDFLEHDPKYKSTIQLNVRYDEKAQCNQIDAFLNSVMKSSDVPVIIQYIGYSCTQDISQQRSLLIDGNKENGKSTFIDLVTALIGGDLISRQSIHDLNTDRYATAQLDGKVVNVFPDLSSRKLRDNSTFKMLTTDRYITGEEKYHRKKIFKNTIHQIYSANEIPDVENPDELAFFRRWIMVTFPYTFAGKKADKTIKTKITTEIELSGFFNVCMVGLRALLKMGEFCVNDTAEIIQKKYLTKSNPLRAFIDECTTYSDRDLQKSVLYDEYVSWCKSKDILHIKTNPVFGKELKNIGVEGGRESAGERKSVYYNLALVYNPSGQEKNAMTDFSVVTDSEIECIRHSNHSNLSIVKKYEKIYHDIYVYINSFQTCPDAVTDLKINPADNDKIRHGSFGCHDGAMTDSTNSQKDQRTRIKDVHDIILNIQSGNGNRATRDAIRSAAEDIGIDDTDDILKHMASQGQVLQHETDIFQVI